MQKPNVVALTVTLLGAAKLVLQAFGIDVPDTTINDITNGVAAVFAVVGPLVTHFKHVKVVQGPQTPVTPSTSK